jgi:single-stranded DNA-specific DHH superfamily exonuclease
MIEDTRMRRLKMDLIKASDILTSNVMIVSHFDADGLSSAIILAKALRRANINYKITIVSTLTPEKMERIANENQLTIFLDFGSTASRKINIENPIIILDHHTPPQTPPPILALEINPHKYDIDGNTEISSATLTYLLTITIHPKNEDLINYALAGAYGDTNELSGINKALLEKAITKGYLKQTETEYLTNDGTSIKTLTTFLNAVGKLYKENIIENIINDNIRQETIEEILREYKQKLAILLTKLQLLKPYKSTKWINVYYIDTRERIIGTILQTALYSGFLDKSKIHVGICPSDTPPYLKVSIRMTDAFKDLHLHLGKILQQITEYGGGHDTAAGTLIKESEVNDFIEKLDKIINHTLTNNP